MHTHTISLPVPQAVELDEKKLALLGVCGIFLDSIEAGAPNVEVTFDITDGADDRAIVTYLRGR
jgi:hypothetical protein